MRFSYSKILKRNHLPNTSINNHLIIFLAVLVAVIIFFYANFNGLGLTFDSIKYLEKSMVFANTHSFQKTGFPELFPFQSLEIVLLSILGTNAMVIMKYLHAFLFGGTVFIHLTIAKEMFESKKSLPIYALTLVFSTPLLMVHSFLWTEPLFIFLVSLQWYLLWRFFHHKTLKTIIYILLLSVLYCWQRKAGMLFSLGLVLAFTVHFVSSKKQFWGILIALCLSVFILYGGLGTINFIGEYPVLSSFPLNLKNYSDALSAWIFPLPLNFWIRIGLFVLVMGAAGTVMWKTIPEIKEAKRKYITSIIIIILTYYIVRHFYDRPDADEADRFLTPVYPGIFFLLIFVLERILSKMGRGFFRPVLPVILALWLTYPVVRTFKNAKQWHKRTKIPLLMKKEIQPTHKK